MYWARSFGNNNNAIYVGDVDSKTRHRLVAVLSNAVYAAGYLLYLGAQTSWPSPFDAEKAQLMGDSIPIAEEVASNSVWIIANFNYLIDKMMFSLRVGRRRKYAVNLVRPI